MQMSDQGVEFLKKWEGLRLEAYQDGGGRWTIGYGHTGDVRPGETITRQEAEDLLIEDVGWAEDAVSRMITLPLSQKEFDALVSFTFNVGAEAFRTSTLRSVLNAGLRLQVPEQLCRWIYDNGQMIHGLARRRVAESQMFLED